SQTELTLWFLLFLFAAFIRKVYSILTAMLLVTVATSSFLIYSKSAQVWVQSSPGFVIASSILSLVVYLILFWKRKSYPTNYILLSIFTLLQSFAIGAIVTFYDSSVVLQAFLITSGVFIGLTLFTFQTKYDFSGLAPVLFVGLLVLVLAGIVNIFIPFSHGLNLFIAILGVLVFSGLVLWDTQMICQQLSPEEYILGVVGLYLDFINLFLYVLRLFQECKEN
ncbi:inhibitor of apoptosis-promoting Bax1-domain-containing protein, partial [Paraphysoderma sedebokerense]